MADGHSQAGAAVLVALRWAAFWDGCLCFLSTGIVFMPNVQLLHWNDYPWRLFIVFDRQAAIHQS